jgi:transcriptional regulator with XRE-family HTH domain
MAVGRALRDRDRGVPVKQAARRLKEERERQGLTLEQVVQKSGLDAALLNRLENDENHDPTVASLMRYAEALGKSLEIRLIEGAASASS